MNKNTAQRHREERKAIKASGGFPTPVFRAKKKDFPLSDKGISLSEQREMWPPTRKKGQ